VLLNRLFGITPTDATPAAIATAMAAYINASAGDVPATRALTAGAGLTGGGTLAADRAFAVGANADGSIVVNADDIQLGPIPPTALFALDLTLILGTKTLASGKDLTNATLVSVRLKTALTAVGQPTATFVAGANGAVTVTSKAPDATTLTTDVSTYTCLFVGAV
jgi:hypothetical protein